MYAYRNNISDLKQANPTARSSPRHQQIENATFQKHQDKTKVVSLFSGCGGMDLGFIGGFEFLGKTYAPLPFEIVWANELNPHACATYSHNIDKNIICGDIWQVMETLPESADVVIGGFPCQDISINGKQQGVNGSRSGLYKAMVEVVKRLKPQVFIAENVKELLMKNHASSLQQVIADFSSLEVGYKVQYKLYHAAEYGIPQTRERVFIVGTAPGLHFEPPVPLFKETEYITASHAISDLESLSENETINHIWSKANKSPDQGNRRLKADRAGYTIRAECHGNIQFHYNQSRRISMREAARIQSFPDSFIFKSKLRETERQIGNAVPPVLAWHIANSVQRTLVE